MPHTRESRQAAGRIGAHRLHSLYESKVLTSKANEAWWQKFRDEVDPDGQLDPGERERRASHAMRAYMLKLSYQSSKARAARKAGAA